MTECINIPIPLLKDVRISLSDIRVYAALSQIAGESMKCSPTRTDIQNNSGVQRVSRYTQNLKKYGYVQIDKTGDGNRNTYTLITGEEMNKKGQVDLKEFEQMFLEYSSGVHSRKTQKTHRTALREFIRIEGNKSLSGIGVREIEHFLSIKKKEASDWTARKYYGSLAAAFEKAMDWEFIKSNPFRKVKKPQPPEVLPLYFSDEEFESLILFIPDKDFKDLCTTGLLTGLRLGELLSLRWNDIDYSEKVIQVKNSATFTTKSKKSRMVSMSDKVFRLLKKREGRIRNESGFIFHDNAGKQLKESTVSQKFKKYVRRSGINERFHFHSLRHTFATQLAKKGVSLYIIQKLMGHSNSKTTEVYAHLLPQYLHREVNILAGIFRL